MTSAESTASDEAALLAATGAGDERAFMALYDRFSGPLYSLVVKMLRNEEDAEEILQSAFLQAWRKAAAYDPERCAPFTWLVLIARSKAIDRLRQRQRQARVVEAAAADGLASPAGGEAADSAVIHHENAAAVGAALQQIPAEQRQAIEMAFFKGMSQTEIAESLAEPLGTIKARIRRGMLRLRDYLGRRL
jgi:RNA polymerase sigma-70 factor, ECF subfamily